MVEDEAAGNAFLPGKVYIPEPTPKMFAALSIGERLRIMPWMEPARRLECIIECDDAVELVRSMDVQDLYLTIKECGLHDSIELVRLMSAEQFKGSLDLECWSRDEILADNAWEWLSACGESGSDVLADKFLSLDFEFGVSLLQEVMKVYIAGEDFNPDEGIPAGSFSADGMHYSVFDCSGDRQDLSEKLLIEIFNKDHDRYFRLLSAVRDGMRLQNQEEAFRWRTGRLADIGFPDYSDALKIYTRPERKRERQTPQVFGPPDGSAPPSFALARHDGFSVIPDNAALMISRLDEKTLSSIAVQAAMLINRILVADKADPGELANILNAIEKARGCISIGLEDKGQISESLISTTPMLDIFRTGYTRTLDLQERALRIINEHPLISGDRKALRLDETARETISALLQPRPMMFRGASNPGSAESGFFSSPDDIRAVSCVLDAADASAELFGSVFRIFKRDVAAMDIRGLNITSRDELTASMLTCTALANGCLGADYSSKPIPLAGLSRVLINMFRSKDGSRPVLLSEGLAGLIDKAAAAVESRRPGLGGAASNYIESCLKLLVDELAFANGGSGLNPMMISSLLINTK
jgi:hypothetical protein